MTRMTPRGGAIRGCGAAGAAMQPQPWCSRTRGARVQPCSKMRNTRRGCVNSSLAAVLCGSVRYRADGVTEPRAKSACAAPLLAVATTQARAGRLGLCLLTKKQKHDLCVCPILTFFVASTASHYDYDAQPSAYDSAPPTYSGPPDTMEAGAVANCVLCDTYFVVVLPRLLPSRKHVRASAVVKPNGMREAYDDVLEAFQTTHAKGDTCYLLPCPTCADLTRTTDATPDASTPASTRRGHGGIGKRHRGGRGGDNDTDDDDNDDDRGAEASARALADDAFLLSGDPCTLTPCHLVSFEEGQLPPIYVDERARRSGDGGGGAGGSGKAKWRLIQGVGPGGLELDRSCRRKTTVFKPSLKPFGATDTDASHRIVRDDATGDAIRRACAFAEALSATQTEEETARRMLRWRDDLKPGTSFRLTRVLHACFTR